MGDKNRAGAYYTYRFFLADLLLWPFLPFVVFVAVVAVVVIVAVAVVQRWMDLYKIAVLLCIVEIITN